MAGVRRARAARGRATLRYGENPHQQAALYLDPNAPAGLAQAEQLHGKEMSYNNYVDADAAWRSANDFTEPCVAIIKHANPCGIAVGADVAEAHRKAHACDPVSAFGGVIAVNREVTARAGRAARRDLHRGDRRAVVSRPRRSTLLREKKNLRVLVAPAWNPPPAEFKQVGGGVLVQMADRIDAPGDDPANWTLATGEPASRRGAATTWRSPGGRSAR